MITLICTEIILRLNKIDAVIFLLRRFKSAEE